MGDFLGGLIIVMMMIIIMVFALVFFSSVLLAPVWIAENYFKYQCESWSFSELRSPDSCLMPRLQDRYYD